MKKLLSSCLKIGLLCGLFALSPIIMDHARDIYLQEVVVKKAMPVKYRDRTIGSSFQIKYNGKRLTVTNNHVCKVVERDARTRAMRKVRKVVSLMRKTGFFKERWLNKLYYRWMKEVKEAEYPVVDESLKVGDLNRKIVYLSENHDICFLEPVGNKYFSLASNVHFGERVSIVGHPRGHKQSISDGRIVGDQFSSVPWLPKAGKIRMLRSTALSYPGNSGSPVINRYGNVVGILFAGWSIDFTNVNMVVPLEALESELQSYND